MPRTTITATAATAIALAFAAAPLAAITAQPATAQESEQATAEYSGQDLDAFTAALMEVSSVREKYNPMLQSAESEEQQEAIVEEANAEMTAAIEGTEGMTLDSYLEIAQAASQDEALNQRIVDRLRAQGMTDE